MSAPVTTRVLVLSDHDTTRGDPVLHRGGARGTRVGPVRSPARRRGDDFLVLTSHEGIEKTRVAHPGHLFRVPPAAVLFFREDLYYRLHVFEIRLPPLRDRRGRAAEDVEADS